MYDVIEVIIHVLYIVSAIQTSLFIYSIFSYLNLVFGIKALGISLFLPLLTSVFSLLLPLICMILHRFISLATSYRVACKIFHFAIYSRLRNASSLFRTLLPLVMSAL